ncbi:uncharacterized protein K444DRAFT_612601 [Hyaloscypha bicolor E]|uniref:Uncharacterized protein n=1 Tax=Hyaloscypha bicolor E TaxID=1095630 RepID=A0A2J6TBP2_9HELO|nr:uncharacterized protein K444DRAFT_612601 [Hyaloscypha bicolor E]PMD60444.1 hypothetical protein K444DRAFT_612601 [Hyaloscypha bicolor E]
MDVRDRTRSDLHLAQLRSQSAPNTPGLPISPSHSQHTKYPRFPLPIYSSNPSATAEDGYAGAPGTRLVEAKPSSALAVKLFAPQAPPIKIHGTIPKVAQTGFGAPALPKERVIEHIAAAPGEQTYNAIPIPGAYTSPLTSSGLAQPHHQ